MGHWTQGHAALIVSSPPRWGPMAGVLLLLADLSRRCQELPKLGERPTKPANRSATGVKSPRPQALLVGLSCVQGGLVRWASKGCPRQWGGGCLGDTMGQLTFIH